MATLLSSIESQARLHLVETTASFWSSAELINIASAGIRDLWRSIADLKGEHFFTVNNDTVMLSANSSTISGLPGDIHKITLIEPRDTSADGSNSGLVFKPLEYQHPLFQNARARDAVDPDNNTIYYAITQAGGPVGALTIYVAPQVSGAVNLSLAYVPTIGVFVAGSSNPIPGESDNALIAWVVAYARAKEREDRSPDPSWIGIYATEKQNILQGLGLRQLQEEQFAEAVFSQYW